MLKIDKADKYFNKGKKNQIHVIDNTTLELADTGLVALLGPSGCGKTTLLNVIGGLDRIKKGKIFINDKKISSRCTRKVDKIRNINVGYIFQDYKLINNKSVFDNVAIVLKMLGIKDKKEIAKRVEYVLNKVGMFRYRKRPASMLSGGEKQRVAIARAIVKDPDIILADEPTGNLDSRNSLEIMKILQAISKNRLVILVTHEKKLANFYANRIIEIKDGVVTSDRENDETVELDYQIDSTFYLKDFEHHEELKDKDYDINIYSARDEKVQVDLVISNGNIYIRSKNDNKLEVVDDYSSIEFKDEHYKATTKEDIDKYNFDLEGISDKKYKKRYSSIYNIFTSIIYGFKKIFDYSVLKKLLLVGFFLSGAFVLYAVSSIYATYLINDADFVSVHKDYLSVESKKIKVADFREYMNEESVDYILPGNSSVILNIPLNDYFQSRYESVATSGSLASLKLINESDLTYGRMPENSREIVLDQKLAKQITGYDTSTMVGIITNEQLIGRKAVVGEGREYTIVGIVDMISPCIYMDESEFVNVLYENNMEQKNVYDYNEYKSKLTLKKGRWPIYDYEVIVNINYKDEMKLNKRINEKVNGVKLKVVGYYSSRDNYEMFFVNNNTVKYDLINHSSDMMIYSKDKAATIEYFKNKSMNIKDTYESNRQIYKESIRGNRQSIVISSSIILAISLIEVFLMVRSSFLSRIKEVGILRAIGVKKSDIYKMFVGEIIAITTLGGIPGIAMCAYILQVLSHNSIFEISMFVINIPVILITLAILYGFNLLVGLIPVFNVIRKTPAAILARHDLD